MMSSSTADEAKDPKGLMGRLKQVVGRPAHLEPVDADSWYVVLDSEFHGPISRRTLAEVLAEHANDDETPLWSASHADEWTSVKDVPGLAAEVAACRTARAGREKVTHPSELAAFAASGSERPPPMRSSNSGEVDIGAALRAMSAKGAPINPDLALGVTITNAPAEPVSKRSPARMPSSSFGWLAGGVVLGGLAVLALVSPLLGTPAAATPESALPPVALAPSPIEPSPTEPPSAVAPIVAAAMPVAPVVVDPAMVVRVADERDEARAAVRAEEAAEPQVVGAAPPSLDEVFPAEAAPIEEAPIEEAPIEEAAPALVEEESAPSIDQLIARAVPTEPTAPPAVEEAPMARAAPTDAEVVRALDGVRDAVTACTPVHAVAALRITLNGRSGAVSGVYVDGVFSGTPVGSCIARAVRRAHVAPFSDATFTMSYPYRL
jgi:hypothetical protein